MNIFYSDEMMMIMIMYPGWCAGEEDRPEQGAHHGDLQAVHGGVRRRGDVPHAVHQAEQGAGTCCDAAISNQYSENGSEIVTGGKFKHLCCLSTINQTLEMVKKLSRFRHV